VAPSRLQRPGRRGSAASNSEGRAGGASRAASMHGRDLPTTRCSFSERCSAVFLEASSSLGRPPAGCMVLTCRRPIQLRPRSRIDVAFRRVPACASGMAPIRPRTSWNARACWSHRLSAPPSISRVPVPGRSCRGSGQGAALSADRPGGVSSVCRDASRVDWDLPSQASRRPRRACDGVGHGDAPARAPVSARAFLVRKFRLRCTTTRGDSSPVPTSTIQTSGSPWSTTAAVIGKAWSRTTAARTAC
jgi:hypothetical protein